jgi:hypothetical protein
MLWTWRGYMLANVINVNIYTYVDNVMNARRERVGAGEPVFE